jgi:FAD/FMN-containing dehydrogenase
MDRKDALDQIRSLVGPQGLVGDEEALQYLTEWRDKFEGKAALIVRPGSTKEVSDVLNLANEAGIGVVPQSGNTGLVGGQIPSEAGDEIVLSLSRMNRVGRIDTLNDTVKVEAGCVLATVQNAAREVGRLFPLSLGSEGSAQIGGLLSTNAGGVNVLKYGNAKAQVLGLEVVLADGRVWNGLRGLRKDNTGYDLKQLFMGAEGTLGIITSAILKLFPLPRETATAYAALPDLETAIKLLAFTRERTGDMTTAFELVPQIGFEFLEKHAGLKCPLESIKPWSVLIELSSSQESADLTSVIEDLLEAALDKGLIVDGAIAGSLRQAAEFWGIRERLSEIQKAEGGSIKHDVAVQISDIPAFVEKATSAVAAICPKVRPFIFGHVGDGNLHFNMTQPEDMDKSAYLERWPEISRIVHDIVTQMGGSISAEHGIGQLKVDDLARYKSEVEMDLMRTMKKALDPNGIMNPGKIL